MNMQGENEQAMAMSTPAMSATQSPITDFNLANITLGSHHQVARVKTLPWTYNVPKDLECYLHS